MNVKRIFSVAGALILLSACQRPSAGGGPSRSGDGKIAFFDMRSGAPEEASGDALGFGPAAKNEFYHLVARLERARNDKKVRAIFIRWGMSSIGLARAEELGRNLEAVKKEKPVFCHAEGLVNATYMAAARGCSVIAITPNGGVETIGLGMESVYLHKLLAEDLKVDIDMIQIGKYKGAEEWATRDSASPEVREYMTALLADQRTSWLAASRRGTKTEAEWTKLLQDGPYGANASVEHGLVDRVAFEQDLVTDLEKQIGTEKHETYFGGRHSELDESEEFGDMLRAASGSEGPRGPVALVVASGAISMGSSGGGLGGSSGITDAEHSKLFRKLAEDERVKAVVVRLDSPGGSALASDLIWRAMMDIRAKKPLVISVGGMAASGGQYMASAGTYVFAEQTSILGSIGVVGGKLTFGRALQRFGVNTEAFTGEREDVTAQKRARADSVFTPFDETTRERLRALMGETYDLFLKRIAEGRNTTVDKVEPHAEGRLFTGKSARERGLVDEMGGLANAYAKARELAHLPADARVYRANHKKTLLDVLVGAEKDDEEARARAVMISAALGPIPRSMLRVKPFIEAAAPLLQGERVLCAVPFALTVD